MTSPSFSPIELESWTQRSASRSGVVEPWAAAELAELTEYNRRTGGTLPVFQNIEKLADSRCLAVVAGQQAGYFLTPVYIIYKAAAAVLWAEALQKMLSRPVTPIFWIASEDHDFDEVKKSFFISKEGSLTDVEYGAGENTEEWQKRSVFAIPFAKKAVLNDLKTIEESTPDTEYKKEILDRWRNAVERSNDLCGFFGSLLHDLFAEKGLVLVPSHLGVVRHRAQKVIEQEIRRPGESTRVLKEESQRLKQRGEAAPIHRSGNEINFFVYRDQKRCKVTFKEGAFHIHLIEGRIERAAAEDLLLELKESPDRFSPNVVLRPIVQDCVFPTLATIGGPGERAYLNQIRPVYSLFSIPPSEVLPRPRVLMVEHRIERLLKKFEINDSILATEDWGAVESKILDKLAVPSIEHAKNLRQLNEEWFGKFEAEFLESNSPAIQSSLEKTRSHIFQAIDQMEKRLKNEVEKREGETSAQIEKIRLSLFPDQGIQERKLGPLSPYLVNYGYYWIEWLMQKINIQDSSLQIFYLSEIKL